MNAFSANKLTRRSGDLTHVRRGERQIVPVNTVTAAIALLLAAMRFGPEAL